MRTPPCATAALLLAGLAGGARADAPLASETADVIGDGQCQVELALARARAGAGGGGGPSSRGADALASCGVRGDHQVAVGNSQERAGGDTTRSLRAFVKRTLVAPEGGRTGWGLRVGLDAARQHGNAWQHEGVELLALATREFSPGLLVHGNLGHTYQRSTRQGTTLWSLGMETAANTTVAADLFGDDRSAPWLSAGVGRKWGGGVTTSASVAVQFDRPRLTQWTLGAKFEF